jgi:peptidyl-prolyl cis-trans isomerase A (cyclophilin A)
MNYRQVWTVALLALVTSSCGRTEDEVPAELRNPLLYPKRLDETAPETFRAHFETTEGDFVIEVHREWAPLGADRFYNLVKNGFYDDHRIYRVVEGFMVQFGIHPDPLVDYQWRDELILDDPVVATNARGRVSFAKGSANSRTVEIFISYRNNPELDRRGFAPFGEVVEGMEVVDAFYAEYGDGPPRGDGVYQAQAQAQGAEYFDAEFPELDRVTRAWVEADSVITPPAG